MTWSPCPPRYVHRRAVQGVKPTGDRATTIFDLRVDRQHVAVYPGTVGTFAILIDRAGVQTLVAGIASGSACAAPGLHPIHGRRLLGLRPCADGQCSAGMELSVILPGAQVHIRYGRHELPVLRECLTELLGLMRDPDRQ